MCNDETNIKECLYDGMDCCGLDEFNDGDYDDDYDFELITHLCSDCYCQG